MEQFDRDANKLVIHLASKHEEWIAEAISSRIGETSKYVSGKVITPPYAVSTEKRKKKKIPDLYETGAFLGSIAIEISSDGEAINTYSKDIKYEQGLLGKYEVGGDLFGLNRERLDELSALIKPKFINEFRKTVLG